MQPERLGGGIGRRRNLKSSVTVGSNPTLGTNHERRTKQAQQVTDEEGPAWPPKG